MTPLLSYSRRFCVSLLLLQVLQLSIWLPIVTSNDADPQQDTGTETTASTTSNDTTPPSPPPITIMTESSLRKLLAHLRHGDYDLVRPSPTPETQAKQQEVCPDQLDSLVVTIVNTTTTTSASLLVRGLAAEGIMLCTTNQPSHRAHFAASASKGIHTALVTLLKDAWDVFRTSDPATHEALRSTAVKAMAQAAEAIWILSFQSADHVYHFLEADVISILGDIITGITVPSDHAPAYQPVLAAPAVMWSLAALQNLAANYCSDDGSSNCHWTWIPDDIVPYGRLGIEQGETPPVAPALATRARYEIVHYQNSNHHNLLTTILEWVCAGPVSQIPDVTYAWPASTVLIWVPHDDQDTMTPEHIMAQAAENELLDNTIHLQSSSIVPWAAVGVVKNLLLGSPDIRNAIKLHDRIDVLPCLCPYTQSPDWLELSKVEEALYYWANPDHYNVAEDHDYCPHVYEDCMDYTHWHDHEGETCKSFYHHHWCLEYGHHQDEQYGVTARHACCACGGGWRGQERLEHEHELVEHEEDYDSDEYSSDEEPEL